MLLWLQRLQTLLYNSGLVIVNYFEVKYYDSLSAIHTLFYSNNQETK